MIAQRWKHFQTARIAPGFRLEDVYSGKTIRLGDVSEDRIILTFLPGVWAPWCRKLISELNQNFQELIKDGMQFIAVISQDPDELLEFMHENEINFDILADPHGVVSTRYGMFDAQVQEPMAISKPSIFVLDKDRHLLCSFLGKHLADRPSLEEIVHKAEEPPMFKIDRPSFLRKLFSSAFGFLKRPNYA